ncbi:MAG: dockerin type I domain-containing protein [Phycisphaerales bacterium]|nr:dockerin type I domain-containing protein [Phycisphaerales bacterium]
MSSISFPWVRILSPGRCYMAVLVGMTLLFLSGQTLRAQSVVFSLDSQGEPLTEIVLDLYSHATIEVDAPPGPLNCGSIDPPLCIADVHEIDTFLEPCGDDTLEYPLFATGGFFSFDAELQADRLWNPDDPPGESYFAEANAYCHAWGAVDITNSCFIFDGGVEALGITPEQLLSYEVFSPHPCAPTCIICPDGIGCCPDPACESECSQCVPIDEALAHSIGGTGTTPGGLPGSPWHMGIPFFTQGSVSPFVFARITMELNPYDGVPLCPGGFTSEAGVLKVVFDGNESEPSFNGFETDITLTLKTAGTLVWEGWILADEGDPLCDGKEPDLDVFFEAWHQFYEKSLWEHENKTQACLYRDTFNVTVEFGPCDCECPADLNGDGEVEVGDLLELIAAWGDPGCGGTIPCCADLDGDGNVSVTDLLALIAAWGSCSDSAAAALPIEVQNCMSRTGLDSVKLRDCLERSSLAPGPELKP